MVYYVCISDLSILLVLIMFVLLGYVSCNFLSLLHFNVFSRLFFNHNFVFILDIELTHLLVVF